VASAADWRGAACAACLHSWAALPGLPQLQADWLLRLQKTNDPPGWAAVNPCLGFNSLTNTCVSPPPPPHTHTPALAGYQADMRFKETQQYLRPLFARLKNRSLGALRPCACPRPPCRRPCPPRRHAAPRRHQPQLLPDRTASSAALRCIRLSLALFPFTDHTSFRLPPLPQNTICRPLPAGGSHDDRGALQGAQLPGSVRGVLFWGRRGGR
jgi:hypothetical protein